jgi:hypothetical protein
VYSFWVTLEEEAIVDDLGDDGGNIENIPDSL